MDTAELQDDIDKLSRILDEPEEELSGIYDDTLDSGSVISAGAGTHSILMSTFPRSFTCQSSASAPDVQGKHECGQPDNGRNPPLQPDDQQTGTCGARSVLSDIDKDEDQFTHQLPDTKGLPENGNASTHISQTADTGLVAPSGESPSLLPAPNSRELETSSRAQQSDVSTSLLPPLDNHALQTLSGAQQNVIPAPPSPPVLPASDNYTPENVSCAQQGEVPPPPPPPPPPLPPVPDNHTLETSSRVQQNGMPPTLQSASDSHSLDALSGAQQRAMPPPPPPDDMLHDFEGDLQESYTPDFDPPEAVMESVAGTSVASEVSASGGPGMRDMDAGSWMDVGNAASVSSDISQLSQILGIPDTGGGGDFVRGEDLVTRQQQDTAPVPLTDAGESSGLQGDINKLSRVLDAAPVASPLQFYPVSQPTVAPSPHRTLSTGRSRSSTCGENGQPSAASVSGLSLPSALGDELLSQDDFLDDMFIDQEIPVNLENCLALNAAYQEVVDENLAELEQLLRRNRARQTELNALLSSDPGRTKKAPKTTLARWNWHQFMYQHFSDEDGFGPMPNSDTSAKTLRKEYEDLRWSKPWLQSERETLFEAMLEEARQRYLRVAHHKVTAVRNALRQLKDSTESERAEAALTTLNAQLEEAERRFNEAKETSVIDILAEMDDEYDWEKIAQTTLNSQRTARECRLQWCNFLRPTISHAEWTPKEDERVRAAVKDKDSPNRWQAAADELGRTAFQVFQRWAALLSVPKRIFWTKEESERLMKAVESVRIGNYINWSQVSLRLFGRNAGQCKQRYKTLISERRRGRFSAEEDMRLIVTIEELGIKDYRDLAAYIPGRTVAQLRNRYMRYLSSAVSRCDWTREDDEQLVRFVCENGPQWSRAAAEIGNGRNGAHCRMRFGRIEFAFQCRGGVPASGSLAGKTRGFYLDYYTNLRERLKDRLQRLKPSGEKDQTEARKQAAMAFLKRKVPMVRRGDKSRRGVAVLRKLQRKVVWGSSIGGVMISEGRHPHRRSYVDHLANLPPALSHRDAEAATVTARAWCLPPPSLERLESCADAGPPASRYDVKVFCDWRDSLLPDAPESSLRRTASAVGQHEYNWRRMPLVPASYASCNAFRSLLLQRSRLEEHAVERGGIDESRTKKMDAFNREVSAWAERTMTGGAEADAPRLVPGGANGKHHQDRVVRVRVTEKPPGRPSRQFYLTVAAAEADNPDQLAGRIVRQVPHMVKMDICRGPQSVGGAQTRQPSQPALAQPGPPPAADAADAWHLLLSRFVSTFFWPALLSLQPPPDVTDLGGPDLDLDDSVGLLGLYSARDGGEVTVEAGGGSGTRQPQKRAPPKQPKPQGKRRRKSS